MTLRTWIPLPLSLLLALGLVGCPASDDDDSAVMDDDDATGDDDDATGDDDDATGEDPFVFRDDAASAFVRVDRIGMPAVATALIASKDAYNDGEPSDDLADFAGEVIASVEYVHHGSGVKGEFPGLDAALASLSLTPCGPSDTEPSIGKCIDQALSVNALPDTLTIDLGSPAGFPNGRALADPVIDVTLAVLLLDLDVHSVTTFIDLNGDGTVLEAGDTLNPAGNDVAFESAFPYLAPAW